MSCYMTLWSEVLPSLFLISFFVWLYLLHYAWNLEYKFYNSQILLLCSWEVLPHFVALEKCCIRIRNLSAVFGHFGTIAEFVALTHTPPSTHITHTWPCHAFFAKASNFFTPGAHPDGKEIGIWTHLALLSLSFVYALCTFLMERCPVGPKLSERQENFNRCKACK